MSTPVLLADIGGTNARFALTRAPGTAGASDTTDTALDDVSIREFAVADYASLADAAPLLPSFLDTGTGE